MTTSKRYITVLTGAGVSAESGVPTFRDSNGLWCNHKIEDIASWRGWERNPELVWEFYKKRHDDLKQVQPNQAHIELAKLEQLAEQYGYEFLLITQNVDGLHHLAGSKKVVELHGDLRTLRCENCKYQTNASSYWETSTVPRCPMCDNHLRVNVVWFGEELPLDPYYAAEHAIENSDLLMVVGTSGEVYPAAGFVRIARSRGAAICECNIKPAFFQHQYDFDNNGYRCFRAKASIGVGLAVLDIKNFLISKSKK